MKFNINKEELMYNAGMCFDKIADMGANAVFTVKNMLDILVEEARKEEIYAALGRKYYSLKGNAPDDELKCLCDAVRKTEHKLAVLKEKKLLNKMFGENI